MDFDIAIIGAGLAGKIATLALARAGRSVALVAPAPERADRRTTALMDQSIRLLQRLDLWPRIAPFAAKLATLRIIDTTWRLLRAPPLAFKAAEIGLEAFGWNIRNETLIAVLDEAAAREGNITAIDGLAQDFAIGHDRVSITLANGERLTAAFLVGADGRRSPVREAASIGVWSWSYPQTALVLNFSHERPHENASTEFHTAAGPFTQVPLEGNRSSLVWVVMPQEAAALTALPPEALNGRIETQMQSMLGKIVIEGKVQTWPLSGMVARCFGKSRVALIGEAGHGFPPIGAQGLNLSLRDVMVLTEVAGGLGESDIPADAGARFDRRRRADIISRTLSIDLLNRSLLSPFLPVQAVRAVGLTFLSGRTPLRGLVMHEGIAPGSGLKHFWEKWNPVFHPRLR